MLIFGASLLQNYYMKKILLLTLAAGLALPAMAQKNKKQNSKNPSQTAVPPPDQASALNPEQMRQLHEFSMPGPMHQKFNEWSGHWQERIKSWIKEGGKPAEYQLMCDCRPIMDGRFLLTEVRGVVNGMPYEGQEILGWDNARKIYVSSWIDNQGTGIMNMEGSFDEASNTITFRGSVSSPSSPEPVKVRVVWKIKSPSQIEKEFYVEREGKESKTMEVNMMRG
jgi:hypothetical protein